MKRWFLSYVIVYNGAGPATRGTCRYGMQSWEGEHPLTIVGRWNLQNGHESTTIPLFWQEIPEEIATIDKETPLLSSVTNYLPG